VRGTHCVALPLDSPQPVAAPVAAPRGSTGKLAFAVTRHALPPQDGLSRFGTVVGIDSDPATQEGSGVAWSSLSSKSGGGQPDRGSTAAASVFHCPSSAVGLRECVGGPRTDGGTDGRGGTELGAPLFLATASYGARQLQCVTPVGAGATSGCDSEDSSEAALRHSLVALLGAPHADAMQTTVQLL
jgi:hypothetical protein